MFKKKQEKKQDLKAVVACARSGHVYHKFQKGPEPQQKLDTSAKGMFPIFKYDIERESINA